MRRLTRRDQVGFIQCMQDRGMQDQGMQEWFNIQNTTNVIHHIKRLKKRKKHIIVSIAKANALDKIQHPFLIKTLDRFSSSSLHIRSLEIATLFQWITHSWGKYISNSWGQEVTWQTSAPHWQMNTEKRNPRALTSVEGGGGVVKTKAKVVKIVKTKR